MSGAHLDSPAGGLDTALIHGHAFKPCHLVILYRQPFGPGGINQLAALVEHRRNTGHQHRLLGIDRAAQSAVTQVGAAPHVAGDYLPVQAEFLAATAQYVIIGVGRHSPGADTKAVLHADEPGRKVLATVTLYVVLAGPVRQRWFGSAKA